uniref:Uncharacterized protein n=1 Tax=Helianthus annuus TaxID=4232 RepID=A0A251UT11_HELAN
MYFMFVDPTQTPILQSPITQYIPSNIISYLIFAYISYSINQTYVCSTQEGIIIIITKSSRKSLK